jgi:hypothetical protein
VPAVAAEGSIAVHEERTHARARKKRARTHPHPPRARARARARAAPPPPHAFSRPRKSLAAVTRLAIAKNVTANSCDQPVPRPGHTFWSHAVTRSHRLTPRGHKVTISVHPNAVTTAHPSRSQLTKSVAKRTKGL